MVYGLSKLTRGLSAAKTYTGLYFERKFPRFFGNGNGKNGNHDHNGNGNGQLEAHVYHSEADFSPSLLDKANKYVLAEWARRRSLYPYFREISSEQDTQVVMAKTGKKALMFGSNSYLGLTSHPKVKEAAIEAVKKYGSGNAGSRFLNGTLDIHVKLEEAIAEFVGKPAALVYSTGFQTNLGAFSLVGPKDISILDREDHSSIYQGSKLSEGEMVRYKHGDMQELEGILQSLKPSRGKFVVVDGIFSMGGDIVDLPKICEFRRKYNAAVMVDDAHSFGVIGKNGAGTASHFGLTDEVDVIMSTFSKSLASQGGFLAADSKVIDFLKHNSKPLIFSASMPPSNVASTQAALDIIKSEPERIQKLWDNTARMKAGLTSLGYDIGQSQSPILPVKIGGLENVIRFCLKLEDEGVFVNPVVSPAVVKGDELIRVSLMATHSYDQIDFALDKFEKVGKEMGKI